MSLHKKKSKNKYKDDFTVEEDEVSSICNLTEGEPLIEGNILRSFSFEDSDEPDEISPNSNAPSASSNESSNTPINSNSSPAATALTCDEINPKPSDVETILDHRTSTANPNGRTPPVDGEIFDMVRTYTLRRSTIRILSKIKAIHVDDNVYLNTIVDEAIRHYYYYLKNNLKD